MRGKPGQAGAKVPGAFTENVSDLTQPVSAETGGKDCNKGGVEITPEMVDAGVAFLREALGDLYPAPLLDERELVAELFREMARAADCPEICSDPDAKPE